MRLGHRSTPRANTIFRSLMVCPQLKIPVMLDDFGLLFVKPRQLRMRLLIDTKQFVELGMQRKRVAPVRALDEQRYNPDREGRDCIPVERPAVQHQPQQRVEHDHGES